MPRFQVKYQINSMDCGPACLCMIAMHYGKRFTLKYFRDRCHITREGVSLYNLSEAAEEAGLHTLCARITENQLAEEIPLPCILHWNNNHYVICYQVKGKGKNRKFYVSDPCLGKMKYSSKEMHKHWLSGKIDGEDVGIAMQIEPGIDFEAILSQTSESHLGYRFFLKYILPHKREIAQLLFSAIVLMVVGYFLPFISQSIVDIGVMGRDLNFIMLMAFTQLVISISQTGIMFLQSWVSLHINTIINIRLISDYLRKLANLPLQFFEIRSMGDILQRIGDHDRIKNFLMNDMISIIFSLGTFITFFCVLAVFNWRILLVFMIGNSIYIVWILSFMKYRREIDNKTFQQSTDLQNNMVQFIQGMQEIKLNNIEKQKCWEWEHLQAKLYKLSRRALIIGQIQSVGSTAFSTSTNIILTYLTAKMVVNGEMTIGMMTSLSFIIGQVAGPMNSFIAFALDYQDAKISMERLSDIHEQESEHKDSGNTTMKIPQDGDISLNHLKFSYNGSAKELVLKDISLFIPHNKVTAIVGKSGCGKTTLIKLLQGFYKPTDGDITVGETSLASLNKHLWREQIGSVMQNGYIFSDTIANNICVYDKKDKKRLDQALAQVNLKQFVESLPHGYNTKIGNEGLQLSQGQRQRILLARVIYKNPRYIFLDEATNSLDTQNELEIMRNIKSAFSGHTTIIVAHRLSTIRHADNIVVIDNGCIVEQGTHDYLLGIKGHYYNLIQSQLNQLV